MQSFLACAQRRSDAMANKMQNSVCPLGSVEDGRPQEHPSVDHLELMLAVLADPRRGSSSCRVKMQKNLCRTSESLADPAGFQHCSRCLKAQPQHSPQSSCWGWQGMAITGYVDFWSSLSDYPSNYKPWSRSNRPLMPVRAVVSFGSMPWRRDADPEMVLVL